MMNKSVEARRCVKLVHYVQWRGDVKRLIAAQ